MPTAKRFEDLIAWQKARTLTQRIYAATRNGSFAKDFGLKDQIQRAAVSIVANIAEGFDRGKRTEFHQFLSTAKGSCAELRSHLYVALDAGHLTTDFFTTLNSLSEELSRILGGLRAAVAKQRDEQKSG